MKQIIYKFNDGTTNIAEVTDEFYAIYQEIEKQEKRIERKETRRHISFEYLCEKGIEITNNQIAIDEMDSLEKYMDILTPAQQRLIRQIFDYRMTETEIAQQEGVSRCSISKRLARIFTKIKKIYDCPPTFDLSRGYKCRDNSLEAIKEAKND